MPLIPSLDSWRNRQVNQFSIDIANQLPVATESGKEVTRHHVSLPQGLHGDTVLVAGVNTGTAKVQVRLVDKLWKVNTYQTFHFIV